MSLIKAVSTEVQGHKIQVAIPQKKTVLIRGNLGEHFLHVVESLLAQDFSGYYWDLDKQYGYSYKEITGTSTMLFADGAITSCDKVVQVGGKVPNVHVVRYLAGGNQFRSFYMTQELSKYSPVYTDMKHYSPILENARWLRLIGVVNNLVGFELVRLADGDLKFNFDESSPISVDGQKIIYLLMAECYLTPENYSRVLLLPDIPYLENDMEMRFLEALDNIRGHSLTLSTMPAELKDIPEGSSISFLTV